MIRQPDAALATAARERQTRLTKPPGALGRLEALAVQLASLQGRARPTVDHVHIAVFAADHGVTAEGVSAFPPTVTVEMIRNFARGGAAISVLAARLGAALEVVDVGTATDYDLPDGVRRERAARGTANLRRAPAMDRPAREAAEASGTASVARALADGAELFIGGEMGIGNTTAATALACALLDAPATELTGPGTGLDADGVTRKAAVIDAALALHRPHCHTPEAALERLGGLEIAALAGAYRACGVQGLPALVDGFIASVAALAALRREPALAPWLLFAHRSGEPGHARVLAAMDADPVLDLGMRLGEGSGAAAAVPLLRLACALHNDMATFEEAGVSEG